MGREVPAAAGAGPVRQPGGGRDAEWPCRWAERRGASGLHFSTRLLLRFATLSLVVLFTVPAFAQDAPLADSLGVRELDASMMETLPDRTAEALGSLLLGSGDDPSLLGVVYRGADRPQYVVDGVRTGATEALPQAALLRLGVPTGYVSPRLGNSLGAFVQVETRDGPQDRVGYAEGTGGLDAYGYGRASLGVGTRVSGLRFFGAGTVERGDDLDPRAWGTPVLPADELAAIRETPQVLQLDRALADAAGFDASRARYTYDDTYYVPYPEAGTAGTREDLAAAVGLTDPGAIVSNTPLSSLLVRGGDVPLETVAPASEGERFRGHLAMEAEPIRGVRLRLSGQGFRETGRDYRVDLAYAAPEAMPTTRDEAWRGLAEAEADLGPGTLRLALGTERRQHLAYDGRFSDRIEDTIRWGDIDDPANAIAREYVRLNTSGFEEGAFEIEPSVRDGVLLLPDYERGFFVVPGNGVAEYVRETATGGTLAASYELQVAGVRLAAGVDADTQTLRGVRIAPQLFAAYLEDGNVEVPVLDTDGDGYADAGVTAYDQIPAYRVNGTVYGYDYLGLREADEGTAYDEYWEARQNSESTFAPRRPTYAAGYTEAEWSRGAFSARGGLRVARFSSNATALYDLYAPLPVYRVEDYAGGGVPENIPTSAAILFYPSGGTDQIVGYRDLDGVVYDASGVEVEPEEVFTSARGQYLVTGDGAATRDAPSRIVVLPRLSVELRFGGFTLGAFVNAFARQPPPELSFLSPEDVIEMSSFSLIPNGGLRPERLTEVGATLRQSVGREGGARGEVEATVFMRSYRDRIRRERLAYAFPAYTTYTNSGTADVPGVSMRAQASVGRLGALAVASAQRESFWQQVSTTSGFDGTDNLWTYDAAAAFTLTTEPADGPALGSFRPFADTRVGVVFRAASGTEYGPHEMGWDSRPLTYWATFGEWGQGPSRSRVDLRFARALRIGGSRLEASVDVLNLFGQVNAIAVYPTTGLPDDDGTLADVWWLTSANNDVESETLSAAYAARLRDPAHVGRPRMVQVGLRLSL